MMRKFQTLLPLAALALAAGPVLLAAPAFATEITCGTVSMANPNTGMLRLSDGSEFKVSYPVLLKGTQPGDAVRVTQNNNGTVGITEDNRFASPQDGGPGSCLAP